jgi:cell division protease FtsH
MRKVPLSEDVDSSKIARGTGEAGGADLANLVNEAALFAARGGLRLVGMNQFELAKDKIMMGAERRSMVMSEAEKRNTAYHEAGHAIVGRLMPEHDPVYKVSIIPRGRALGVTMFLPEEDRYSHSRRHIISQITSLFGGRVAEEMTLGKDGITTGASNDIQRATEVARNMVTKWGLSESMGPLMYDEGGEEVFLGRSAGQPAKAMSDETALAIDREVRNIIDECYDKAHKLLEDNRDKLDKMADALMQFETIDAEQIDDIMQGKSPRPPSDWSGDDRGTPPDEGEAESAGNPIGGAATEH